MIASIITIMITKENLPSSNFIVDVSLNVTWHNQINLARAKISDIVCTNLK